MVVVVVVGLLCFLAGAMIERSRGLMWISDGFRLLADRYPTNDGNTLTRASDVSDAFSSRGRFPRRRLS